MNPSRRKLFARLALGLGVLTGVIWLASLDYSKHISLDVLDLIPTDEREPELAMVRKLASEKQGRIALFALDPSVGQEAADQFIATLRQSGDFAEVEQMGDPEMRNVFGEYVFRHRFELLLPEWLAAHAAEYRKMNDPMPWGDWLAQRAAAEFETYLSSAEAMAFEDLLTADPLLLVPGMIDRVRGIGETVTGGNSNEQILIWSRGAGSPLEPEAQQSLFETIDQASAQLESTPDGERMSWTGVARFAANSREQIKAEVTRLNVLSFVAVLAVAALCLQRAHKILHVVPVVVCSLLGAWVVTTLIVPRVHILVLVVGALLCGIAIDYAFHVYLHPFHSGEDFAKRMRSVLKPLLVGAFTTAVGFSFLLMAELPFIRHLGIFVTAGLVCAVASALLWFSQIDEPYANTRALADAPFAGMRALARGSDGRMRTGTRILLGCVAAIALAGPWLLTWHDDIRELELPAPELYANDRNIRSLFGESAEHATYLTRGENPSEARNALEKFLEWHSQHHPDAQTASLGFALPTEPHYELLPNELENLAGFSQAFREKLEQRGFETDHFQPFFDQWRALLRRKEWPSYNQVVSDFSGMLRGPLALMMGTDRGSSWFATVTDQAAGAEPPAETATVSSGQLQTLNHLFGRYRKSALRLSLLGLGVAALGVLGLYGPKRALRIVALPASACLFAFGLFGVTGQTLNLFHLIGAFLGICLSFDYAVFAAESAARHEPPPTSIRLSALTTAASFGVLTTSAIPVVSALGATVATIVLIALLGVELMPRRS